MLFRRVFIPLVVTAFFVACVCRDATASGDSEITFDVVTCAADSAEVPILRTAASNKYGTEGFERQQVSWSRSASSFVGIFKMKPGWIRGYIETTNCWTPTFEIAVLPGHSRHFSWFLVPKKILLGTLRNVDIVVAGELPLPNLRVLFANDIQAVIDDGVFYINYYRGGDPQNLRVIEPQSPLRPQYFSVDLRRVAQYEILRRDITMSEYTGELLKWERTFKSTL